MLFWHKSRHSRRSNWLKPRFSPFYSYSSTTATNIASSTDSQVASALLPSSTSSLSTVTPDTSSSTSSATSTGQSSSADSPNFSSTSTGSSTSTSSSSSGISSSTSISSPTPLPTTTPITTLTPATDVLPTYTSQPPGTLTFPSVSSSSTATNVASSNSRASTSSGVSTGALVGGIAAGIIGLAAVAFALIYFLRRCNRRDPDEGFDSDIFRRQSVMLADDESIPYSPDRGRGGFNPRPPTMIERHLANATPVSPTAPQFGQYSEAAYNPPGIVPGQVFAAQNPFHNQYEDAPHDPTYNGNLAPQPTYLSRQPSTTDSPGQFENHPNDAQYVDMSRSSVTPFQATQYEEISRRLDIPSPALGHVVEEESDNVSPSYSSPHVTTPLESSWSPVYELIPSSRLPTPAVGGTTPPPAPAHVPQGKRPDTVYTVYGDDDAYVGI